MRAALGAGRGRLARALLIETAVLGLAGGTVGLGVAYAGLQVLTALGSDSLPRMGEIAIDSVVIVKVTSTGSRRRSRVVSVTATGIPGKGLP